MRGHIIVLLLALCKTAVGIQVIKEIKFVPGTSAWGKDNDGIVQVLLEESTAPGTGKWFAVCNLGFTEIATQVFCYEMGFENKGALQITTKSTTLAINVKDVKCTITDTSNPKSFTIGRCSYTAPSSTCPTANILAIQCGNKRPTAPVTPGTPDMATVPPVNCSGSSDVVRLVNGTSSSGRVEIFHNGEWGTICNTGFYQNEAKVICKMACLTSDYASAVSGNFPPGTGKIWFSNLRCPGNANTTNDCTHSGWGSPQSWCKHTMDARVQCGPSTVITPPPPNPDVVCTEAQASVVFNRTKNPDLAADMLALQPATTYDTAKCGFNVVVNATHVEAKFKFTECGGTTEFNSSATLYTNNILRMFRPSGGVIYETNYTVPVICIVPKVNQGNGGNIGPKIVTVPPKIGKDKLSLELTLYKDAAFTETIPPGSTIQLKTTIYVKVKEKALLAENQMAVRNCWATASSSRTSTPRTDLIVNACPVTAAALGVSPLRSIDAMTQSFSFKSFLFSGSSKLFVHCDTITCHMTDTNANCRRACASGRRRKRSADNMFTDLSKSSLKFRAIDGGPFYIVDGPVGSSTTPIFSSILLLVAFLLRMF